MNSDVTSREFIERDAITCLQQLSTNDACYSLLLPQTDPEEF